MVQKEDKQSCWNLLTFNSVTSVMDDGVKKQLNFEDLLQLPSEMDPSFCHNKLLFCWKDQYSRNCLNPSFFWAICCAYGWSYVSLGLLKVFPDLKSAMFSHLLDSKEKKKKEFYISRFSFHGDVDVIEASNSCFFSYILWYSLYPNFSPNHLGISNLQ